MNKYQEALNDLKMAINYPTSKYNDSRLIEIHFSTLQELVEKATPKKVTKRYYTEKYGNHGTKKRVDIRCSCCNSSFTNGTRTSIGVYEDREIDFIKTVEEIKYCEYCGQAIDWSEEE